jgi:menaquinone-dependent protoporphyrinogen oxidase
MSKLWIAYATVEGQSAKIAEWLAARARRAGLDAEATDLSRRPTPPPDCEQVILVASIHSGRHGHVVRSFVREHREWLAARPSAFLSVRLSAAADRAEAAEELLEAFLASCGWTPDVALPVAGALPYSKYGFLMRRILRAIAKREGGPTDTSQDYELTDWPALSQTLDDFLASERGLRLEQVS